MSDARVLTFGETMGLGVNEQPGALTASRSYRMSFGGAESNVAIALRRLGTSATWVSRLGDDPFGRLIARELAAEGVEVVAGIDPAHATGFMLKERRTATSGSVTFWRDGSAASRLRPDDIPDALIEAADLVHVTGITLGLSPGTRAAVFDVLERAQRRGTRISFDVNHRERLWPAAVAAEHYGDVLPYADIVFAGDEEAAMIVGPGEPIDLARELIRRGAGEAVIKLGADGCAAVIDGTAHRVAAHPVDVVDTVGAGDAFVAGYLHEFLAGAGAAARLTTAVTAGALACTSLGDWEGSPDARDLRALGAKEGIDR